MNCVILLNSFVTSKCPFKVAITNVIIYNENLYTYVHVIYL